MRRIQTKPGEPQRNMKQDQDAWTKPGNTKNIRKKKHMKENKRKKRNETRSRFWRDVFGQCYKRIKNEEFDFGFLLLKVCFWRLPDVDWIKPLNLPIEVCFDVCYRWPIECSYIVEVLSLRIDWCELLIMWKMGSTVTYKNVHTRIYTHTNSRV